MKFRERISAYRKTLEFLIIKNKLLMIANSGSVFNLKLTDRWKVRGQMVSLPSTVLQMQQEYKKHSLTIWVL